jgi:hypothetical protein
MGMWLFVRKKLNGKSLAVKTIQLAIGLGKVLETQEEDPDMEYSPLELSQRDPGDWNTPVRNVSLSNTESRLSTNSFFVQAKAFARKVLTFPGSPLYHSMTMSAEEAFVAELTHGAKRSKADGQRAWERFTLDKTDLDTFPNVVDLPCLSGRFLVEENGGQVPFAGLYPRNTTGQVPVQAKEVVVDETAAALKEIASAFKVIATPLTVAAADTFTHKAIILDVHRDRMPFDAEGSILSIRDDFDDFTMTVYDAVKKACIGTQILSADEETRQLIQTNKMVGYFTVGDNWKLPSHQWKGKTLERAVFLELGKEERVLRITVSFEVVLHAIETVEDVL